MRIFFWVVLWVGLGPLAWAAPMPLTLVYTGNLNGELEPCGCSAEGDFGGIKRQTTALDKLRKRTPNLILISSGGLLGTDENRNRTTDAFILKGIAAQRYDALGLQWQDLTYGADFIAQNGLPWAVINASDGGFAANRTLHRAGHTLAFFSWLDPRSSPGKAMQGEHTGASDDTAALTRALHAARTRGALTVLTTTLELSDAQALLPLDDIDVLLVKAKSELFGAPQRVGNTLVLQPGTRGQRFGRVDLSFNNSGRIAEYTYEVIPLPKTVPDAPRMQRWYDAYNAAVAANYRAFVATSKARKSADNPFVGAQACQSCHAQEYDVWNASHHARALADLTRVKKDFDPACLLCHTVGFAQPGGFIDVAATDHLANVQCESCHGAARDHVGSGGVKPVPNAAWPREKICAQCHTQPHSPAFKFETYWPKIAHPPTSAAGH